MSRVCSFRCVTLPNWRRASSRAAVGAQPVRPVLGLAHRQMKRQLVVEIALEASAASAASR